MGRGKRDERPPFPSSHRPPRAFYFFYYNILMQGHGLLFDGDTHAGASAEERAHKSLLAQVSEGLFVALTEVKI